MAALGATTCSGGSSSSDRASPTASPGSARPHLSLPPGFSAPNTTGAAPTPGLLQASPVTQLQVGQLQQAPLPKELVHDVAIAIVNQPLPTAVRPLLVSSTALKPGITITVAAARLSTTPPHDALFILQGPGYRAQRLVQVKDGLAAAVVTLPTAMERGTWALAAEDLSQIQAGPHNSVKGTVLLDLGIFSVG